MQSQHPEKGLEGMSQCRAKAGDNSIFSFNRDVAYTTRDVD